VIIKDGEILTIRKKDKFGEYYVLPGGKQKKYEEIMETVKRECMEEINLEVVPEKILFLREYIGKNHEYKEIDYKKHKMEFFIKCKIVDGNLLNGKNPDENQKEPKWLKLDKIEKYNFFPKELAGKLKKAEESIEFLYLGDIN
jgi:8-oxo-dGTP pyrophosphatase MutT (NUDIX family)